jgi:hypothetical protein
MCLGAVHVWPTHLEYVASCLNSRISSVKGTSAFALMFGREPNGFQDYSDEKTNTFNQDAWEKHMQKLNYLVRPAIEQKVNIAHLIRQDNFNAKHKLVVFHAGDRVMAKDVTRTNKWHSFYEGPFEIVKLNKGGAYILKDKANSLLPFRFPPSHLRLVPHSETLMEKSYAIKRILAHAAITGQPDKYDYYVQFAIPDSTPVWISAEMFDSTMPIEQYWKGTRQSLKANSIDCSAHDENLNVNDETHNGNINAEHALMEGVGLTSVSEALSQPSTDLTQQTDRPAVIPLDAQIQTDPLLAVVPLDVIIIRRKLI